MKTTIHITLLLLVMAIFQVTEGRAADQTIPVPDMVTMVDLAPPPAYPAG